MFNFDAFDFQHDHPQKEVTPMLHLACAMQTQQCSNFTLMLLVTANVEGAPEQYRFTRQMHAIDYSDVERLQLILEAEKTDFVYQSVIEIIEMETGITDFKLCEVDAVDCEEGRDYHEPLECEITDYELIGTGTNQNREIWHKTIGGGEQFSAFTHGEAF
jgi:hypothetical protein